MKFVTIVPLSFWIALVFSILGTIVIAAIVIWWAA